MKLAMFPVSAELMTHMLGLPPNCIVRSVVFDQLRNSFQVQVESDQFIDVADGELVPTRIPHYRIEGEKPVFTEWTP